MEWQWRWSSHFYPRPPRGGRLDALYCHDCDNVISIHALREEGDSLPMPQPTTSTSFLSTPSARRATQTSSGHCAGSRDFYPRPPRGGRQSIHRHPPGQRWNFYPRPPRGGRHRPFATASGLSRFLSTPSARRATPSKAQHQRVCKISIHALREEGDDL